MATASATPKPLYITGKPDADKLLHNNGLALMIGMLLDQQVPMEWAFTGAYTIKQRIGHCDAKKIAAERERPEASRMGRTQRNIMRRRPQLMDKRAQHDLHDVCFAPNVAECSVRAAKRALLGLPNAHLAKPSLLP